MSEATGTDNEQQVRAAWIEAMRPRTLPLAAAGSVVAAGIAAAADQFRIEVLVLMFVTSILLQIIANFADDYGDLSHGLDDETIASAARVSAGTAAGWRSDVENYLSPISFDIGNSQGYEIPERISDEFC